MTRYYPAFLNIESRRVVVIGGGNVAYRKVRALLEAGAKITVISPELSSDFMELVATEAIQYVKDTFRESHIRGAWLVVAATDDPLVQEQVYEACERERVFCNVVDVPERCSFIVPSLVRRGALNIAISTSGLGPGLSKALRRELEALFPESYAQFVECVGRLRKLVLAKCQDPGEKKRRLKILFDLDAAKWFIDGDRAAIERWAQEIGGREALEIVREYHG